MEYFPVSPVAPPNKIALPKNKFIKPFAIYVMVCPNLANGYYPCESIFCIQILLN